MTFNELKDKLEEYYGTRDLMILKDNMKDFITRIRREENGTDSDSIENDRISIEHSASNETYSLDNGAHGETYNLDEIREIIKKKQPITVTPLREENLLERIADSLDDIKDLLKELLRK